MAFVLACSKEERLKKRGAELSQQLGSSAGMIRVDCIVSSQMLSEFS